MTLRRGRRARARGAAVAFALTFFRAASTPARSDAHPLHTTFTELRIDAAHGVIEARVRLFADDLAAVTGARSPRGAEDAVPLPSGATSYLRGHVSLRARQGVLAFEDCGVERHGDALVFCLRVFDHPVGALSLRNTLFTERFADQVNVVRVEGVGGGTSSTFLLTRASPEHAVR
jgi:uncharacterized protein DUF6702